MNNARLAKHLLVIGTMLVLSGCQLLAPSHQARAGGEARIKADKAPRTLLSATAQGRDHLRANRTGQAIEAFNVALMTGEAPAPAYNGLGVAYARLGRPDLAYRFFKKATMSDPENPVFPRNLAMLMDSPGFNLAAMNRGEAQITPPAAPTIAPATRQAAAQRTPGKLFHEARGQYSLITTRPTDGSTVALGTDCTRKTGVKRKTGACAGPAMPQTASRNAHPKVLAAETAAAQPAVPDAARKPQRKSIDLPAALQDGAAAPTTARGRSAS
jgi:tetratricopeptide (TPR) repeat protein